MPSQPIVEDSTPIILGWWEWARLPGLSSHPIKAKCDTGAAGSVLHAEDITFIQRGELTFVKFKIFTDEQHIELPQQKQRGVRSSNGESQSRPLVLMPVQVAGRTFAISATLTDRTPMNYPMLLGRSALAGRFVVDPATSNIHRKPRGRH